MPHAADADFILVEQLGNFLDRNTALIQESTNLFLKACGHVAQLPADASVGSSETRTSQLLTEIVDLFALGECVEEDSHCADVHGAHTDPEHVGGNAGEFAAQHAQCLTARGKFPAHQFFHGAGIGDIVGQGRQVVQAVGVGNELIVVHVFGDLLIAPMQETDVGLSTDDGFTIQLQDQTQHAVRGRVRWSHVQSHALAVKIIGFGVVVIASLVGFGKGIRSFVGSFHEWEMVERIVEKSKRRKLTNQLKEWLRIEAKHQDR